MAKFSVSIPDGLKASLDSYGKLHNLGPSQVVQEALALLLHAEKPGDHPAHPSDPIDESLLETRIAIIAQTCKAFAQHQELVRAALEKLAKEIPTAPHIPPAFPEMPW